MIRTLIVAIALAVTTTASAGTRRVAVVIGNNRGVDPKAALRYAELDADKLARVLVELGGVVPEDLFVLQGKGLRAVEETLQRAKMKIAAYRRQLDHVVVIFYFSGHSDGVALELGSERLTFAALRAWLADTGGEVRLAVVDSCKSGALLAAKGGTPGPAFHIRLTDELSSTGEALLTSSAADENALESKEIGGSFFTHHLVSGLRGAADASGDGRVTLTEAYQYAYQHTLATSGATLAGPQHPTYDYRLSGEGELILTELAAPSASVGLPDGFDRALVVDAVHARVIAELGRGDPRRVALEPGRYTVRAWRGGRTFEHTLALVAGQQRVVEWSELSLVVGPTSRAKSDAIAGRSVELGLAAGGFASVATRLDFLAGARAEIRSAEWNLAIEAGSRRDGELRESAAFVLVGWRATKTLGPLRGALGFEVGGGAVVQRLDDRAWTGAGMVSPRGELAMPLGARLSLALQARVAATVLDADDRIQLMLQPAVWLGVIAVP